MKYPGLRLLVSGAALDREFFDKDFDTLLEDVQDFCASNGIDSQLDDDQIAAARAAHGAIDMRNVFELDYWPTYNLLRDDGTIPDASPKAFWEM